jgi:predicted metallopeptidase
MAMLKYEHARELDGIVADVIGTLKIKHLDPQRIFCMRSRGSSSRSILARIHPMQRIVADALDAKTVYVIEAISENFDKLGDEEKIQTLIHELLHIPKTFGGGLLSHRRFATSRRVKKLYGEYIKAKNYPQVELALPVHRKGHSRQSDT